MAGSEVKRTYNSPSRTARARETRQRILAAATRLFIEHGYAATSVNDVAGEVGVTARLVYLTFPSKRALLDGAIALALGGDNEQITLRDREWFRATLDAPGREIPGLFARFTTALHERSAALLEAAEAAAAADSEIAERARVGHARRRSDMRRIGDEIAHKLNVDAEYAADLLYTLGSSTVYALFVFQCGWSPQRYQSWLTETLELDLLRPTS
jgi:AcrR family transcriptional regulator